MVQLNEPMKHSLHSGAKQVSVRWGVVIGVVVAVSAVVSIAFAAWYVAAVSIPQYKNSQLMHSMEDGQLQILSSRVARIEAALHIK
jgi:hypothetical protein